MMRPTSKYLSKYSRELRSSIRGTKSRSTEYPFFDSEIVLEEKDKIIEIVNIMQVM